MSATVQTGYFFMPEHIILVGASERPHSLGERIFSHLLGSSYQGKITPVNLRHSSVAGIPSYSSPIITTRCSRPAVKKTCATLS